MDQYVFREIITISSAIICAAGLAGTLASNYALYLKQKNNLIIQAVDFKLERASAPEYEEAEDGSILKYLFMIGPDLADKRFNKGKFDREIERMIAEELKDGRIYEGSVPHAEGLFLGLLHDPEVGKD